MTTVKTICHQDGTLSFWSTQDQQRKERVAQITTTDITSFDDRAQGRVRAHLDAHSWTHFQGRFSLRAD